MKGLEQLVQYVNSSDYNSGLALISHMVTGSDFAQIATFMTGLKILLQTAQQLRINWEQLRRLVRETTVWWNQGFDQWVKSKERLHLRCITFQFVQLLKKNKPRYWKTPSYFIVFKAKGIKEQNNNNIELFFCAI